MPVKARRIAFAGMLLALAEAVLYLASVLPISSGYLTLVASLTIGIVILIATPRFGLVFLGAALLLGWLILPDKAVLLLFAWAGTYQYFLERWQPKLLMKCPVWLVWVIKMVLVNLVLIPLLIYMPRLFLDEEAENAGILLPVFWLLWQFLTVAFDFMYFALKKKYGPRIAALVRGGAHHGG
ncbi:MAG: hypothetical protein IJM90_04225 [Firmicutes bacterium]|nr:hypothetical protein [Bacillota bacterium]